MHISDFLYFFFFSSNSFPPLLRFPPPQITMAPNGVATPQNNLIISFSEMLIDFVPTESDVSLAEAPCFLKAPDGALVNVAIAVTRLGIQSAIVRKLGDDKFGHMLTDILKQNDIFGDEIYFDEGARTAFAFVTLRADGEREFIFFRNPSADMLLKSDELNLDLIRSESDLQSRSIRPDF